MALVNLNFESQYLGNAHNVTIILPDKPRDDDAKDYYTKGKKYKVLWLLHGSFDDGSGFLRRTMIEVYAREKDLIVVMPSAMNSNYTNWDSFGTGFKMGDYLTEELMPLVHNWFPASSKPEDNFISGDSMGGRGALKYILEYPDKFAAAAVLSASPRDPEEMDWNSNDTKSMFSVANPRFQNTLKNVGGKEAYLKSYENTWGRLMEMHEAGNLPKLMFACADKDFGYDAHLKFKKVCHEKGIDAHFFELPNLGHEWRFWDKALVEALKFFGINEEGFIAF